jgi:pilus assembly protein FimV
VLPDLQTDQQKLSDTPTPASESNTDLDLDLDFSLDEPDLPDLPEIERILPDLRAPAATEPLPLAAQNDAPWTLPEEPIEPNEPVEAPAQVAPVEPAAPESAHMQLDYTMMADETPRTNDAFDKTQVLAVAPAQEKPAADSGMMEFDLGSLSLDFAVTKPGELANPDDAASGLKPDLDEEPVTQAGAFPDAADNPLETKLALAEEFKAIGDDDGARALIEEVIAEATGEMKAKAQQALKQL